MSLKRALKARIEDSEQTLANFVAKLWDILDNPKNSHLISWSDEGHTFVVKNPTEFSRNVLPHYFKHNNFQSFVRQLNLYGFRKMARPDGGSLSRSVMSEDSMEFWHTHFNKDQPEKLYMVQRRQGSKHQHEPKLKVSHKSSETEEVVPHRLSAVMSDIHQMKGRQENIASILDALKQDNSHLRHELILLKDKHVRQQKILNKIIHFLVHMVYKRKIPSARRPPRATRPANRLMLTDSEMMPPQPKKIHVEDDSSIEELSFTDLPSPGVDLSDIPLSPNMLSSTSALTSALAIPSTINTVSSTFTPTPDYIPTSAIVLPQPPAADSPSITALSPATPASADSALSPQSLASPQPTPLQTTFTSTSLPQVDASNLQYPQIPETLLKTCPIPPAPSNLLSIPHPENQMCIHGQLNHQQQGIDNLPEFLSGQLSLDPSIVADFVLSEHHPTELPDYDFGDTARLLESLSSSDDLNSFINLDALQGGSLAVEEATPMTTPVGDPFLTTRESASPPAQLSLAK